jgi:hypothetical protein
VSGGLDRACSVRARAHSIVCFRHMDGAELAESATGIGAPACPLPLDSLSSPLVTDRVMKHAHTRQGLLAAVANGDGERAQDVRGGQP